MPKRTSKIESGLWCVAGVLATVIAATGCSSDAKRAGEASAQTQTSEAAAAPSAKGRAQLWTENCSQCHNIRSPGHYSDAQWGVVMQHMRVRGYLTGEEQRQILQFLRAAN